MRRHAQLYIYLIIALLFVVGFVLPGADVDVYAARRTTFASDDSRSFSLGTGIEVVTGSPGDVSLNLTESRSRDTGASALALLDADHDAAWNTEEFVPRAIYSDYDLDSEVNDTNLATGAESGLKPSGRFQIRTQASSPVSDDFNTCALNTSLWTLVDPQEVATLAMAGTNTTDAWVSLSVPGGAKHTLSGSNTDAPRIMQAIENTQNFTIEVKFESGVSSRYQMQGILVEEVAGSRFLRFDFHNDGSSTRIYATSFSTPTLTDKTNQSIAVSNVAPLYMRVKRAGDSWTQYYSFDGTVFTPTVTFADTLNVTAVGVFAGNSFVPPPDNSSPAHTALIDYFFNTASPIDPEDGDLQNTLTVERVGSGVVDKDPDKAAYACGEVITLAATADPGWSFDGWSGDLVGNTTPDTLTISGDHVVTATFVVKVFLPIILR